MGHNIQKFTVNSLQLSTEQLTTDSTGLQNVES